MRSAEQQVFFDEFVEFLKKYKGKNVDTATLAAKVEEIWGDTLGKDAAGKLSDLRGSNPEIFKNIKKMDSEPQFCRYHHENWYSYSVHLKD